MEFARTHKKPWLHLCADEKAPAEKLRAFVEEHRVKVLNVVLSRASGEPRVIQFVTTVLDKTFSR